MKINGDWVEAEPLKRRGTKKKVWDDLTRTWKDVTIWTVEATRGLRDWLDENYPDQAGWGFAWSGTKIVMEEAVYIHYALKFEL
jgi:hypothetical protein